MNGPYQFHPTGAPAQNPAFAGTVTLPPGSAQAPSVVFPGSPGAGLYQPGAGSIGFSVSGTLQVNGEVIWHTGNDGPSSGLDADTVDGVQAASFALLSGANFSGRITAGNVISNNVYDQIAAPRPLVAQEDDAGTTLFGSRACITVANGNTTTSNTAQIAFATRTGVNANLYAGAAIGAVFGSRSNGVYPGADLVFGAGVYGSAPVERMRLTGAGVLTVLGNTVWHAGNDGSGSALDADTLDTYHASSFALLSGATFTGDIAIGPSGNSGRIFHGYGDTRFIIRAGTSGFQINNNQNTEIILHASDSSVTYKNNHVWHAGNDGSGSGLDADLLDGQHSSYFAPAASPNFTGSVYISGSQCITSRRTGWGAPTGTDVRATFDTASATTQQIAERLKALIDDLTTHGLIGA